MIAQTMLLDFERMAGASPPCSDDFCQDLVLKGMAPALSLTEAQLYARAVVGGMGLGEEFTCRELFAGVRVRFDRRNLAQAIIPLRGTKIISAGVRKEPRENGNEGYSTVWKVIGNGSK